MPQPNNGLQDGPEISVSIGNIEIDYTARYSNDDGFDGGIWTDYMVKNFYEGDEHVYMTGITSPNGFQGKKAAFFQLAAPTLIWVCRWTACKFNVKPAVPSFAPPNEHWILLDKHLEPVMMGLAGDGVSPLFRLSGTYTYGCDNPDAVKLSFPKAPWMDDSVDRSIQGSQFQMGISDVQQGLYPGAITTPLGSTKETSSRIPPASPGVP